MSLCILFWAGYEIKDRLMHDADLFGQYKMLIDSFTPIPYTTGVVSQDLQPAQMATLLETLRRKTVLAAFYVPNLPQYCWRDRSIWEVSDGHQFLMLSDLLKRHGWSDAPTPYKIGSDEFKLARAEADVLLHDLRQAAWSEQMAPAGSK